MTGFEYDGGLINLGDDKITCPHCMHEFYDNDITERINESPVWYTVMNCPKCEKEFCVSANYKGELATWLNDSTF